MTLVRGSRRFRRKGPILALIVMMTAAGIAPEQEQAVRLVAAPPNAGSAVTAPEHPEGTSFNPNQIKDIKAADPGAGVNLIEAPSANNQGDARLSYPLEVPKGRAGLEPELAVAYNSAGANGWLGVGWDVGTPEITVDTRWGVPRYDAGLETETYLLNGEQLTPVAHRGALQARTAEKVFHSRIEGRFDRIVRHGDSPRNYWWEVTDKQGTRTVFGGAADASLADAAGHVATWAVREVRDLNDNVMRYRHVRVTDGGTANSTVAGTNLYPQRITYTGHGDTDGRYSVTFLRDRDRGEPRRADVRIDARGGFKKVTADLLRRVEVKLDDQLVRAYELNYRTGAFAKTLLASVSQFGEDNRLFTTHSFDYFDEVRDQAGGYNAFAEAANWAIADDDLGVNVREGEASALSATTTLGAGGHLYVGYNPLGPVKSGSAGVKVGFSAGVSDGLLALEDVNGDNLPDKVFRKNGGVFYRPNLAVPGGQPKFGDTAIRLPDLPGISSESTLSGTIGIEGYAGVAAAQLDLVSTITTSDRYFADVNGDGIADLVNNGGVLFGYLDANGNPAYTADSGRTPVPVGGGAASGTFVGDQTAAFDRAVDNSPLLDSVRRWVAPFDGTVRIDGRVRLVPDTSPQRAAYDKADGVRVTIQHKDTELWAQRIGPDDHLEFAPTGVGAIPVRKGDALYFRVQSILDGKYDTVAWDPTITYAGSASTDVNGLSNTVYQASRDFTLGGRQSQVTAPLTGAVRLTGDVVKNAATSDDVAVVITRNGQDVLRRTLTGSSTGTTPIDLSIPVTARDTLSWRLRADSQIDVGTLTWVPRAHYTQAQGVDAVVDETGKPTIVINPPFDLDLYPVSNLTAPQRSWTATQTGQLTVQPNIKMRFNTDSRKIVFTVKKRGGQLVGKRVIDIVNGAGLPAELTRITVPVVQGDELFFDFATLDPKMPGVLTEASATVSYNGWTFNPVPAALFASADPGAFAQPYRGWGAIGYQANRDRANRPIIQNELVLDQSFRDSLPMAPTEQDLPGFTANPRVNTPRIAVLAPMPVEGRWAGADDNTWVSAGVAASSRYGTDTIDVLADTDVAGATGVPRRGLTMQISTTLSVGPIGGSVAGGITGGGVDFLDLNGDKFPDVVGPAGIQYSDMAGGLGNTRGTLGGPVRESDSRAFSVSASAGSPARTSSTAGGFDAPTAEVSAAAAETGLEMPSLGLGGNIGGGESATRLDLVDINGDGLPDKVYANGDIALNLGYLFAAREPWPAGPVNTAQTGNLGVNLGFNLDNYGFAGGVSATLGTSKTTASLADINGDGLTDRVFTDGANPVKVAINTGTGFTTPTPFRGSFPDIATDTSAGLGGGAYFTFGFPLGAIPGFIVFNPGVDASTGIGRAETGLRDVNGDGLADHVKSTRDNELVVAANRTGRTNLLRSLSRPMGARIDLDYTRVGNTHSQPESKWVLARTAVFDGHAGDGQDTQLTTYRYDQGHYDRLEREFAGFGSVTTEQRDPGAGDALYRTVTAEYRIDGPYTRGLLARTLTADGAGRPFLETVNTYQLRAAAAGSVFPQLTRVDKRFYEGAATAALSTYTELSYDDHGNVVRTFDAADEGAADDVEATYGYTTSDVACRDRNLVGIAKLVRQRATGPDVLVRHREADVDCATGNVRQVRRYLGDGGVAVNDAEYYPDGNLKSMIGPANKTGQRERFDYGYDTVVGVHIESVVDGFGHRSTTTHDIKHGVPDLTTDENGQQLRRTYDSVGRLDTVTGPYETGSGKTTVDLEYHPEAPLPYAVTRHLDRTATGVRDDTIDTVTFTDGLRRVLQVKKDAAVADALGEAPSQVMVVSGRSTFDFVSRQVEQHYPTTEPKGAGNTTFNPTRDAVTPTRTTFDVLDRVMREVMPDGVATAQQYGFGPDRAGVTRFEKITTDGNGKQRRTYQDVRELTTAVQEFNPAGGQPVIWTGYTYDAIGQITTVVDDHGNTTRAEYDDLGRRTVLESPDTGRSEASYDPAGNLTATVTANLRQAGAAVEYDYDHDRLTAVRYPTFPANDVTYTYGVPGAPDNTAGRIAEVRDAAGTTTRAYGPLDE
jgi:YD repeat-containing protein